MFLQHPKSVSVREAGYRFGGWGHMIGLGEGEQGVPIDRVDLTEPALVQGRWMTDLRIWQHSATQQVMRISRAGNQSFPEVLPNLAWNHPRVYASEIRYRAKTIPKWDQSLYLS